MERQRELAQVPWNTMVDIVRIDVQTKHAQPFHFLGSSSSDRFQQNNNHMQAKKQRACLVYLISRLLNIFADAPCK